MDTAEITFKSKQRLLSKEHWIYIGIHYSEEIEAELYEISYDSLVKKLLKEEKSRDFILGYIESLEERRKLVTTHINARKEK
jgi:hypothetical protein